MFTKKIVGFAVAIALISLSFQIFAVHNSSASRRIRKETWHTRLSTRRCLHALCSIEKQKGVFFANTREFERSPLYPYKIDMSMQLQAENVIIEHKIINHESTYRISLRKDALVYSDSVPCRK